MVAHGVDAVQLALVAQHGDLSQGLVASQKGAIARSSYIDTVPVGQRLRSGCALPPEVDRPHDAIHPSRFPDYIPPSVITWATQSAPKEILLAFKKKVVMEEQLVPSVAAAQS